MPRIALDAMGGDHAPGAVVRGTYSFAKDRPSVEVLLVGREDEVARLLAECGEKLPNISIVHAAESIGMHEHPIESLKAKPEASLPAAVNLVREGKADAVMSCGNTGALMVSATLGLRKLPGVRRAGIATVLPSLTGGMVVIDVGANINCKPVHLVQYGAMGEIFCRAVLTEPGAEVKMALLSVGSEEGKGSTLVKEAHRLFANSGLNFAGNIEGHQVFEGKIKVVVSDGFAGNIVVKVAEGLAEAFLGMVDAHIGKTDLIADERWLKVKKAFRAEADWRESGGAALIGVNGVVMIGHGRCDERAVASALRRTTSLCEKNINDQIVEALGALNDRLAALEK